ncbi:MAG: stage IV sporulation protein A [Clostridia bacterium]|nr:stage IV sporulation protein A [Clostridia bacterium]
MPTSNIYQDIAARTGGDIYIGVVGPVRTGKSTFIKRFMDSLVLPNIEDITKRERANDEMPQSSAGRTIMTTEPKFIPESAAEITLEDSINLRVRLIDCVGYIVPSALGYIENEMPRMVATPWFEEPVPFNMAAEIGTQKVINEHSTIGLVITTDSSIGEIPREEYEEAEERVINELKAINKPFVVLLNCMYPDSKESTELAERLSEKYSTTVLPINCLDLDETQIKNILAKLLKEFPVSNISLKMPYWINSVDRNHWFKQTLYSEIHKLAANVNKISDITAFIEDIKDLDNIISASKLNIDMGNGAVEAEIELDKSFFYTILNELTGLSISSDRDIIETIISLAKSFKEYQRVKNALDEVEATGYGIVMPETEELSLEEPEIVKQGGRYGVRLRASAPSIHMMKANIKTEVSPIVGSEKQSEDLVMYLLKEFEEDPVKIWDSNIFGKSLHDLVNEGLHTKLARMPADARMRLQETIEQVINEGCSGLICIIL